MPGKYILCTLFFLIFFLILWERTRIDVFFFRIWRKIQCRFGQHAIIETKLQGEVEWLQYLLLALRSGESLETALSSRGANLELEDCARKSRSILAGSPEGDSISSLLAASIQGGTPCIPTLQFLRKVKLAEIRDRRKLQALTLGARLQSVILSLIPWVLLASFFVIDDELAYSLIQNQLCWVIWSIALLLCVVGFRWMRRTMEKNVHARDVILRESEELLPGFLLDLIVMVGAGKDVSDACRLAASKLPNTSRLRAFMLDRELHSPNASWVSIRNLIARVEERGSPMREEIFLFLQELQNQKECRWEELAQKLPTQLLAPLFLCFFFSSLLMTFSVMVPFLENF